MKPHSDDAKSTTHPCPSFWQAECELLSSIHHLSRSNHLDTGEALGHMTHHKWHQMTGETARRCKGQRGISEIHLATELWTPVICPKFTVVFPPSGWNLIPSLWGICDSPNFDVQGRCWFLLCHGWRCISHGSNWLFAIDSFYRFDLNLEVFLVWWLRRRRDDFRSRRSFCFCHILRFDLYCDIATRCLCLNGAEWGDVLDRRPIVHREDLRPYRNTGTKTFSSLNIHVLQVLVSLDDANC